MDNYTFDRSINTMFDKIFYDILHKAEINVSNSILDYLSNTSKEEQEKLNNLVKFYGKEEVFNKIGKDKIILEFIRIEGLVKEKNHSTITSKIKSIFKSIFKSLKNKISFTKKIEKENIVIDSKKIIDKPNEEIQKIEEMNEIEIIEQNSNSHLPIKQETQKEQKLAVISATDITNVENKNFQMDVFALEFPLFSLRLDKSKTEYKFISKNNVLITIKSTSLGRATIQDSDIWLYCISKIMQLIYEKKIYTRRIQFTGYDFLKITSKKINGVNYKQIIRSLERLANTTLSTNQLSYNLSLVNESALISNFRYVQQKNTSKVLGIEVFLPDWLIQEIANKQIVKINPEYFKLKPLEKRIYQLARRHCGNRTFSIAFSLNYFSQKTGSILKLKHFRYQIKKLVESQPLPEYKIFYNKKTDQIQFINRNGNTIEQNEKTKKKIEAKNLRETIAKSKQQKILAIDEGLEKIKNFLEIHFSEKKYEIFKTNILTNEKLKEYLHKFQADYIIEKIKANVDFEFLSKNNPEGYFYKILEKELK